MVEIDPELVRRAGQRRLLRRREEEEPRCFQMAVLEPKLALMDETDSGLDIDALQGRGRRGQPPPRNPANGPS